MKYGHVSSSLSRVEVKEGGKHVLFMRKKCRWVCGGGTTEPWLCPVVIVVVVVVVRGGGWGKEGLKIEWAPGKKLR